MNDMQKKTIVYTVKMLGQGIHLYLNHFNTGIFTWKKQRLWSYEIKSYFVALTATVVKIRFVFT